MSDRQRVSTTRRVIDFVVLVLTGVAAWFLWPSFLGGSSQMILVHGHSMEPTFATGDLVLIDTHASPEIGNIVVFQIPKDEPGGGQLVVHRLVGRRDDGTYITKGDNSMSADSFLITRSDILGSPRLSIPHGGQVIGMLSTPIGLGAAAGGLCTVLLWPRKREEDEEAEAQPAPDPSTILVTPPDNLPIAQPVERDWFDAEAEAWLREQLELMTSADA